MSMDKPKKESASVETRTVYVAPQMDIIDIKFKGNILQWSYLDVEEEWDEPGCEDWRMK